MKRLFLITICFLLACKLSAQLLSVDTTEVLLADTYAIDSLRRDYNDNPCAVIKVNVPSVKDLHFDGIIVDALYTADRNTADSIYILYVAEQTRRLRFLHDDYYPGDIVFPSPLKSLTTYQVYLSPHVYEDYSNEGFNWLTIKTKDSYSNIIPNCSIAVGEQVLKTNEKGLAMISLSNGTYEITVSCEGYQNENLELQITEPVQYDIIMTSDSVYQTSLNDKDYNVFSIKDAQKNAWFLTDKMKYELGLTEEQTTDVYEINYDYIRNIKPVGFDSELYTNLRYKNLSYVLDEWQWMMFEATDYFLYPFVSVGNSWDLVIYQHYDRDALYQNFKKDLTKYSGRDYLRTRGIYYKNRGIMHKESLANDPNLLASRSEIIRPFSNKGLQTGEKISSNSSRSGVYKVKVQEASASEHFNVPKQSYTATSYPRNRVGAYTRPRTSSVRYSNWLSNQERTGGHNSLSDRSRNTYLSTRNAERNHNNIGHQRIGERNRPSYSQQRVGHQLGQSDRVDSSTRQSRQSNQVGRSERQSRQSNQVGRSERQSRQSNQVGRSERQSRQSNQVGRSERQSRQSNQVGRSERQSRQSNQVGRSERQSRQSNQGNRSSYQSTPSHQQRSFQGSGGSRGHQRR